MSDKKMPEDFWLFPDFYPELNRGPSPRRLIPEPTPEMREAFDAWRAAKDELHPEVQQVKVQKALFATMQRAAEGHETAIEALKSVGLASGVSAETVAAFQEAFKRCESKD